MRSSIFLPIFAAAVWAQSDATAAASSAESVATSAASEASSSAVRLELKMPTLTIVAKAALRPFYCVFWNVG